MITQSKARMYVWLWMLILCGPWGCGGHWFASEDERNPPLVLPTDAELVGEIFPQHLPSAKPPAEPQYFSHTVRSTGETLIAIARWYTGSGDNWVRIARANPEIKPQRIHIGDAIRIPEEIVTTRRPMPKIDPSTAGAVPKRPPSPAPSTDLELFGPIETPVPSGSTANDNSAPDLETIE
ncbi:MAG: LysM domain-containing protein [Desulfatitalea sp.]